jgi:hypothetical protein
VYVLWQTLVAVAAVMAAEAIMKALAQRLRPAVA